MVFLGFIVIGLVILAIGISMRKQFRKLASTGIPADGVIYETEVSHTESWSFNYPIVRFKTQDGTWITEKSKVSAVPAFKSGEEIKVYYDYNDPTNFMINHPRVQATPKVLIAIGTIILSIGIVLGLLENTPN